MFINSNCYKNTLRFEQFLFKNLNGGVPLAGASISRNLWGGPTYNSQNFLAKSCEFRLHCLCVAIAHLMHFFSVLSRLRNERTVFWKKKEKQKLVEAKSGLVRMKVYLEIYNRVKYFYRIF